MDQDKLTYINKQFLEEQSTKEVSIKELFKHQGIKTAITFLATNRIVIFIGGHNINKFSFWLGQKSSEFPALERIIKVTEEVVSISWNTLVAYPELCSLVITALISCGAIIKWGIHKMSLKHQLKKGTICKENTMKL